MNETSNRGSSESIRYAAMAPDHMYYGVDCGGLDWAVRGGVAVRRGADVKGAVLRIKPRR